MNSSQTVADYKTMWWQKDKRASRYAGKTGHRDPSSLQVTTYTNWVIENHPPRSRILDVGAGTGALTRPLAAAGFHVVALDVSAAMLRRIGRRRGVDMVVADILRDSPPIGVFDAIVSRWVLPHFPQWPAILARMNEYLRVGGSIYVDFPNPEHYRLAGTLNGSLPRDVGYAFDDTSDPETYYAAPTPQEVGVAAAELGLVLEGFRGASFLSGHQLLTGRGIDRISALMVGRTGRRTIREVDELLAEVLPAVLCPLAVYRLVRPAAD